MRLNDLVQPTANDIILREAILTSKKTQDREYITELLPLIPLALWGAGAAWTAYDAWQTKKAYDRGDIDGGDLARIVGTDIAITLAAGGVGKVLGKGWKYGKKIYKSKKAAKEAEKAAVTSAAVAVNKTVKNQVADAGLSKAAVATATANASDIVSPAAAATVRVIKKTDDVVDKVQSKAPDVIAKVKNAVSDVMPHSTAAVAKTVKNKTKRVNVVPHDTTAAATATVAKTSKATVDNLKGKVDDRLQKAADDAAHKKSMANTKRNQEINKTGDFAPATASLVSKKIGKKQADNWTPAAGATGKATSKVIKKKADDVKKPKKKYWGLGGANTGSMHDTNFAKFVDKYAYNK